MAYDAPPVWLEHAFHYLQQGERLHLCQVKQLPKHLLKEARASYRKVLGDIYETLTPLRMTKFCIPGIFEPCRAQDVHFAGWNDLD